MRADAHAGDNAVLDANGELNVAAKALGCDRHGVAAGISCSVQPSIALLHVAAIGQLHFFKGDGLFQHGFSGHFLLLGFLSCDGVLGHGVRRAQAQTGDHHQDGQTESDLANVTHDASPPRICAAA